MPKTNLLKSYIYPIAVFSAGMIGVGFLSLPYIAMRTGIWLTLGYFVIVTALVILINLIFCDVSLKTPDYKRFPGFSEYYLGKPGWVIAMILTVIGSFGALLACLLVGSHFLFSIASPTFGGDSLLYILIYFCLASSFIFLGIKMIQRVDLWVLVFLCLAIIFISIKSIPHIALSNLLVSHLKFDVSDVLLPYGPLLFALSGSALIPEVEEMMIGNKKSLKKVIFISTFGVSIFYLLFTLLILGVTGNQTTESAFTGLKTVFGDGVLFISLFVGILTTMAGFVAQAIILKKVLMFDLKIPRWEAFVITCFTPLILLLAGFNSLIPLLSVLGGFILGISGIMILLMYKKIGGRNGIIYPLSAVFLLGVVYEIIYLIK